MKFLLDNVEGARDATRLSQMTHSWVDGGTGFTEERNRVEHQIGMFLMSERYGPDLAKDIGRYNEYRGFWFLDKQNGNMINALRGGGNTAFQWSDLKHNYEGIEKWEKYHGLHREWQTTPTWEFNIFK